MISRLHLVEGEFYSSWYVLLLSKLLIPTTLYLLYDDNFIGLLDFQVRKVAWNWMDLEVLYITKEDKVVLGTFYGTMCVVNQ